MAIAPLTDEAQAERLLRSALGGDPALTTEQIDDLMQIAVSLNNVTFAAEYTGANLNRAASLGWQWKSSLTANQYDLAGGGGKSLDRSQWFDHCMAMAAGYAAGTFSVLGTPRRSGIGMITVGSSLSEDWSL